MKMATNDNSSVIRRNRPGTKSEVIEIYINTTQEHIQIVGTMFTMTLSYKYLRFHVNIMEKLNVIIFREFLVVKPRGNYWQVRYGSKLRFYRPSLQIWYSVTVLYGSDSIMHKSKLLCF